MGHKQSVPNENTSNHYSRSHPLGIMNAFDICGIKEQVYILWQQRHVSLIVLIKQFLLGQVTLQSLAVNHPIPRQRFAIVADQTRSPRFQMLVRDHLHHLQTTHATLIGDVLQRDSFLPPSCIPPTDLFGNSREFHNMECLVICGRTLVNVDNH